VRIGFPTRGSNRYKSFKHKLSHRAPTLAWLSNRLLQWKYHC